jgi:hypothetical protein
MVVVNMLLLFSMGEMGGASIIWGLVPIDR